MSIQVFQKSEKFSRELNKCDFSVVSSRNSRPTGLFWSGFILEVLPCQICIFYAVCKTSVMSIRELNV